MQSNESHIIRTVKNRTNPYVMITRALAENDNLSFEARGLMLYLLAKPDNWTIRVADLQRAAGRGRDYLRRVIHELEIACYIQREIKRGAGGKLYTELTAHEIPYNAPSPTTGFPSSVEPSSVNPSIYKVITADDNTQHTKRSRPPTPATQETETLSDEWFISEEVEGPTLCLA